MTKEEQRKLHGEMLFYTPHLYKMRKRRVIHCYFEIDEEVDVFSEFLCGHRELPEKGEKDCFRYLNFSSPFYNFPQWDNERNELVETISELEINFGDTMRRQIVFTKLKSSIFQLKNKVGLESRAFLRVLNLCYDALQNVKAENLKESQVDVLKFVVQSMREDIDDFGATQLEEILIQSGLEPIPIVEGIAELYK